MTEGEDTIAVIVKAWDVDANLCGILSLSTCIYWISVDFDSHVVNVEHVVRVHLLKHHREVVGSSLISGRVGVHLYGLCRVIKLYEGWEVLVFHRVNVNLTGVITFRICPCWELVGYDIINIEGKLSLEISIKLWS